MNIKSYELDKFGGCKEKSFLATGFFRVEKDEHWWLVTPEGTPYPDLEAVLIRRILDIY